MHAPIDYSFSTDNINEIGNIISSDTECKSNLIILAGMSASGKDSILNELVKKWNVQRIVSVTTRPMRVNEVDGVDYIFVSDERFKEYIENDELLEYRSYDTYVGGNHETWYYGCIKQELDPHKVYAIVLDMDGAKSFIDYYGKDKCFVVYVYADDNLREKRARTRGSFDKIEWDRRLKDDQEKFNPSIVSKISNFNVSNDDSITPTVMDILLAYREYNLTKETHPKSDPFIMYNSIINGSNIFTAYDRNSTI